MRALKENREVRSESSTTTMCVRASGDESGGVSDEGDNTLWEIAWQKLSDRFDFLERRRLLDRG